MDGPVPIPGQAGLMAAYGDTFRKYAMPFLSYTIFHAARKNGEGTGQESAIVQGQATFGIILKEILDFARENDIFGTRQDVTLRDYFRFVVPRAVNLSHAELDAGTINTDAEPELFTADCRRRHLQFRNNLQKAYDCYRANNNSGGLAAQTYAIGEKENAERICAALTETGKDRLCRLLLKGRNETPPDVRGYFMGGFTENGDSRYLSAGMPGANKQGAGAAAAAQRPARGARRAGRGI